MPSTVKATTSMVASIAGRPLSTTGTSADRTINVADDADVDSKSYTITDAWAAPNIGDVAYPALIHIRSLEIVGTGTTVLISIDNAGTHQMPFEIPPGGDFGPLRVTAAFYLKVAAGTATTFIGAVELPA